MSVTALEMKKAQTEAYFRLHPDSVDISVLTGKGGTVVDTIPGMFDYALITEDARQIGAVEPLKRIPHCTFYSEYENMFRGADDETDVYIEVLDVQWLVDQVKPDLTPGSYQCELWLVQVR